MIAERDSLPSIVFAPEVKSLTAASDLIIHGETRLFDGNKLARESQKEQLELSVVQTGEEIKGMEARLAAKKEEMGLVGAEHEKLLMLFEKKIVDYSRVYSAHRDWARILGEHGEITASIARARAGPARSGFRSSLWIKTQARRPSVTFASSMQRYRS